MLQLRFLRLTGITTRNLRRCWMRMRTRALVAGAIATVVAGSAGAAITGSKHDFRAVGGGTPITGVTDICGSCHVPHRPLMNVPLWAHAFSTQDYYLYN